MTELYESSLTARREALAKHRPAYFARTKRISVCNYSADGLFYLKNKRLSFLFSCHRNVKLFRGVKGSNFT